MDQSQDFKSLQDQISASLIAITRTAGSIASEDLGFHRSFNPEVGTALDEQGQGLLSLAGALLKSATSISELRAPVLEDADDVENNWRNVVDVVDSLLEKSDTCLDEYTGVIKRKEPTTSESSMQVPSRSKKPYSLGVSFRNQNLLKPQLAFDVKPDNQDNSPWKPLLTSKPHAVISLEESLGSLITNDYGLEQYRHPYETEILQLKYPDAVYQKADPIPYLPFETTSATFVDTEEGVLEMLEELKTATEIAIDLEHHDTRSFVGLVSLMQISIRNKDWIVDTLKPWRQNLQVLNEVFADPKIIKVFHGAYMDIGWLQRDLGLYVVGLFDTHHASRVLGYAGGSLAFLLKKFIDFDADKKYQLADWRIRPLPEEMFFYARADTHFLLYIYDMMRNELIDRTNPEDPEENRIEMVLQKSKETSLIRYEKQVYNEESGRGPGGWYSLLFKTPSLLSNEQFAVFRAVHAWRDKIARIEDDSTAFVMSQNVLFSIAKLMPMDMVALLGITHPASHSVKSRSGELLNVIKSAKAEGSTGPSMIDIIRLDSTGATKNRIAVATTSASPAETKTLIAAVDQSDLRSSSSSFWGNTFGSSMWDAPSPNTTPSNLRLAVPLPGIASENFTISDSASPTPKAASPVTVPTPANPIDDMFTLKRSSKRKSEVISSDEGESDSETKPEYDLSFDPLDEVALREKAEGQAALRVKRNEGKLKRQDKRDAKKAKRKAKVRSEDSMDVDKDEEGEDAEEKQEVEEEAFDYSKAESVLHGKRSGEMKDNKKGGKGDKKPFDPYQKSIDAPNGMRRSQKETAGRSHTFKN